MSPHEEEQQHGKHGIRRLIVRFGNLPPHAYLLAYITAIIVFAAVYYFISDQFYHPYVRYEEAMRSEASGLRIALTKSFQKAINDHSLIADGVVLNSDSAIVTDVTPEGSELLVRLWIRIIKEEPNYSETQLPILLRLKPVALSVMRKPGEEAVLTSFPEVDAQQGIPLPEVLSQVFGDLDVIRAGIRKAVQQIVITQDDLTRMRAFTAGFSGFPDRVSGVMGRMLYLSTITITTVGYGDIVPLSGLARFLVGLEATLGIVLLGLFISSLTVQQKKS
jgi:voltage-gated potassium channel Kch